MKRPRLIAALVLTVLLVIVTLQNTENVETKLLFATVTMPRAVLLLTTTLTGFALGILASHLWRRKRGLPEGSQKKSGD